MELDFDKEIDAILRKAHRDGPVLVGDFANANHLDADEISAFAENAMPDNSRALYSAHLAECDRCRKILSNLLVMNADAAPAESRPAVAAVTNVDMPWYRRLFLFPNLAYVMGGLVLVFGGFLAFTVVQNSRVADSGIVSQNTEPASTQGGPYFDAEPVFSANSNTSSVQNSAANTESNMATSRIANAAANANASMMPALQEKSATEAAAGAQNNFVADGKTAEEVTVTAAPPPAAAAPTSTSADQMRTRDADLPKGKLEDKAVGNDAQAPAKKDNTALRRQAPSALSATQSGPSQNNQLQYNRQLEELDNSRADAKRKEARRDEESGRRVVSGKTFERKQGVWYDTGYQGRQTINVRRGTDEFNRLDGGLRSIANSLGGTVVIVWGGRAYRIQ
jgi:hypothetical protein